MGFFNDFLIKLGVVERPKILRQGDRRRLNRRWERTSEYKHSAEYLERLKKDRRKGERRKF